METISLTNPVDLEKSSNNLIINVGSRKSQLALIQTNQIITKLNDFYSNNPDKLYKLIESHNKKLDNYSKYNSIKFNIVSMKTVGDKVLNKPLPKIGTKSLFTQELETELLEGKVEFIVHSLKDLPTTLPEGCIIGAIMKRDNPFDTIVLKKSLRTKINPIDLLTGKLNCDKSFKIGTSSLRRIAMIKRCNPNIECIDIRGNLNTRLSKLDNDESEYTAIILAQAGLDRMNWSDRSSTILKPEIDINLKDWFYAVGQGAIAVECRAGDKFVSDLLEPIVDLKTTYEAIAERSLMKKLEGGCSVPLGVKSTWCGKDEDNEHLKLKLESIVLSTDGKQSVLASDEITLGPHNTHHQNLSEDKKELISKSTTGVEISNKFSIYQENMLTCSELGIKVATKMIEQGCLALIQESCRRMIE